MSLGTHFPILLSETNRQDVAWRADAATREIYRVTPSMTKTVNSRIA
jgi:hypothetical protein